MSGSKRIIVGEITQGPLKGDALAAALDRELNSASQPAKAPEVQPSTKESN